MRYTPHWSIVWQARDALLRGALVTLELTVLSMLLGTAISVFLALGRDSGRPAVARACGAWVEVARNTPCLFQSTWPTSASAPSASTSRASRPS